MGARHGGVRSHIDRFICIAKEEEFNKAGGKVDAHPQQIFTCKLFASNSHLGSDK